MNTRDMNSFVSVIIFSLLAGSAAILGTYSVRLFGQWMKKNSIFVISFAAGVLLANAFLHLLPEATNLTHSWPYWALGTIILFYLIEHAIIIHSCREESCEVHSMGTTSLAGIGFHSLLDGITISIAFGADFSLGLLTSLAIIFHKVADGVCIYSLLIHDAMPRSRALIFSWLVALATPLGAILAYFFIQQISAQAEGWLLAAAAGSFIYIGASDLVPATHKKQSAFNIVFLLLGIIFVLAVGLLASNI